MSHSDDNTELMNLLDELLADRLTSEQSLELQETLRDDPVAQNIYFSYVDLHLGLNHLAASESVRESPLERLEANSTSGKELKRRRTAAAIAAGLLAVVSVVLVCFGRPLLEHIEQPELPTMASLKGSIRIFTAGGQPRTVTAGMPIGAGERLELAEPGEAVIEYKDGTQLTLFNRGSMTIEGRKSIVLHQGIVSARVSRQQTGHPLQLTTPGARVEVLGTRFAVAADDHRTEVNVAQGRVRLTQISDGQSVEVAQGQSVVANGEASLTIRESSQTSETWEVDFENGVPQGWTGKYRTDGLPPGSRGAIQAIEAEGSNPVTCVIESRKEWVNGLFQIHEDSHLQITMKMQNPDWLNVFFLTRQEDATNPAWTLHNFNEVPFWPPKPGRWQTVTIPLSKFRRKRDGVFHKEPPNPGEVVYSLSISATEPDRGLVIDRIWITRGGPGSVVSESLPEQ